MLPGLQGITKNLKRHILSNGPHLFSPQYMVYSKSHWHSYFWSNKQKLLDHNSLRPCISSLPSACFVKNHLRSGYGGDLPAKRLYEHHWLYCHHIEKVEQFFFHCTSNLYCTIFTFGFLWNFIIFKSNSLHSDNHTMDLMLMDYQWLTEQPLFLVARKDFILWSLCSNLDSILIEHDIVKVTCFKFVVFKMLRS